MGGVGAEVVLANVCGPVPEIDITAFRTARVVVPMTETETEIGVDPDLGVGLVVGRADIIPLAVGLHDDVIPGAHSVELTLKKKRRLPILSLEL